MIRAAIYARYSSDRQNERSIDDQIAVCRRTAEARGWSVTVAFSDAAISGAAMMNRPGLLTALASAERREFDVLLCEDEDRIARNLEHLAHVVNRLEFVGVKLATLMTEHVETMHVAFKGAMAQDFLRNLSAKTKRGMTSNAEKGLATGSRLYGYRSQPGGAISIVEDQAEVIREIYTRYAAGEHVRSIVNDLNQRGVPSPRGDLWSASTINGNRSRANGILATELYAGVKVWNRNIVKKDPQTGKRVHHFQPPEVWKRAPAPTARIVSDELWQAVQGRRGEAPGRAAGYAKQERKRGLFTGLIKCARCGASLTAFNSRGRLICAGRREKGQVACSANRSVDRREIETRVLEGMRSRLLSPAAVKLYVRAYHEAYQAEMAASTSAIAPLRKRLAELQRMIGRLVDRICEGTDTPQTNQRLQELEAEKVKIAAELAEVERAAPPPLVLHPSAPEQYARRIDELQTALEVNAKMDEPRWHTAIEKARELIDRIEVDVIGEGRNARVAINLMGTLAAFMKSGENQHQPRLYGVVAGGGIEPPTCGL